jgi:glycosyltransferase involved in cell wall biosynthesis
MFCSTIIATIDRSTLTRAVNSVLNQDFQTGDFELILVNDSGKPLQAGNWGESNRVKVVTTKQRERSVARNTGAAIAKGQFLHFLDDDDWLLPGAFQAFWELSRYSKSDWLYGITQLVDRDGKEIIRLEHGLRGNCFTQIMAGEWIPLQSSLIRSNLFFQVGGFSPSLAGPEDIDLCRKIALHGDFDFTPKMVACVGMGSESSTTDYSQSLITARTTRESILDQPGVFKRLRSSAKSSGLKGRMVRIYLTSAAWNIKHRKLTKAIGRLGFALVSFLDSGSSIFRSGYWRAIGNPYKSDTFLRGFQEVSLSVTSR